MTIQEEPDTFKEKALKTNWPVEEGTDFGTTKQIKDPVLRPEEGSVVNRVGHRGVQ